MRKYLLALISVLFSGIQYLFSQVCPPGQTKIVIKIFPDSYPAETSWTLRDHSGNLVLSGLANSDSICIPDSSCYTFTIFDQFGDGICCNYGNGSYTLYSGGVQVAAGGQFTSQESVDINCPSGSSCSSALNISPGSYIAPVANTWYLFHAASNGMYNITTCNSSNCNTTIWVYDHCGGLVNNTNAGTIYYNDGNNGCGNYGVINAALDTMHAYYIRIGGDSLCGNDSIRWSLIYNGPITGCTDASACNYDPLAGISDSSCLYWPSPLCGGPDLVVDSNDFQGSLYIGSTLSDNCAVQEGCLTGYGNRTIINFTTHIKNTGITDYFIGDPANNPSQFTFNNCHGHPHYEGYAEYVLYKTSGQHIPVGFKNGFCVLDLECSGGGTAQYGCGNMGISHGCGDIYTAGLPCQWIDITDVDPGSYILAIKVNWNQKPDALGRYEMSYLNNWAQVCIDITSDSTGNKDFAINANCAPYVDCSGVPYGNALQDCNGNCNGTAKMGDLNNNAQQEITDAQQYVSEILSGIISPSSCNDLNSDNKITVWDAALLENCANNGTATNTSCIFPHGIINPYQTTKLKIDTINLAQGYIDVSLLSPLTDITAYEFDIHGIQILNIISLISTADYPGNPYYSAGGNKVIGISYVDSSITRLPNYRKLCRIYYSAITDTMICIEKIIDVINNHHEATLHQVDGACWNVNGASIGIREINPENYFIVYPNPSDGNINLTVNFEGSKANLFITDAMGRNIFDKQLNQLQGNHIIDASTLNEGIYLITIKTEKAIESKRIIINK